VNADELRLRELHTKVGEKLLAKIASGEADARDFANAIKFLKDNGIDGIPKFSKPLKDLSTELGLPFDGQSDILQ
jgi:hypothetical protein